MITIVLLSYSTSWSKNETDTIPSTGVLAASSDSVLVSIDDLRKANAKMVELKYEKEINAALLATVNNDNNIIREYSRNTDSLKKQLSKVKKERNIAIGGGLLATLSLVILSIFK